VRSENFVLPLYLVGISNNPKTAIITKKNFGQIMIKTQNETKKIAILMFVAFALSLLARLYWPYHASGVPEFSFNNQVMINTNDGYFYAEGARDLIKGSHETGDRSAVGEPIAIATAWIYKITPFSFETLILFMPAFFGSLVVIPMILIGRSFGQPLLGFFAAVFAATTYSYYNRTMVGYYDSDMFALIMPPFVAAFLISSFKEKKLIWQALFVGFLTLSKILYPQSFSWMAATVVFALLYTLIFDRKDKSVYLMLALSLVAISDLYIAAKIALIVSSFYFQPRITQDIKFLSALIVASAAIFAYFGGLAPVVSAFKAYIFKDSFTVVTSLKYYDVVQTVREAGRMDLNLFASRISGSLPIFVISLAGYAMFVLKERVFALTLPIFGLGLFAYLGGLRFTVYAVPFASLGLFWLIFWGLRKTNEHIRTSVATIAFLIASLPNIYHIYDYQVPTVFNKSVAEELTKLGKAASREDYVFAWWDYGYPIRYYSNVKNHSDGGKHDGSTNFIESFILSATNQRAAANMMRESVEGYEELIKKGEEGQKSTLEYLLSKNKIEPKNYQNFLTLLESESFKGAAKSRDIYLFLPYEMFEILPTVRLFSDVDLLTGHQKNEPYFGMFTEFQESEESINFGEAVFDKKTKTIKIGQNNLPIKTLSVSYYDANGSLVSKTDKLNESAEFHLIAMPSYHAYILADDSYFNSLFVQLFIFENYDKKLFEKVSGSYEAKIFKLKI